MKTVKIGNQEWMAENLNASTFRNGYSISEAKSITEWSNAENESKPTYCYYDNDSANGEKYGKLYNWNAVNDARGLAPEGWHVASNDEWETLIIYLGGEYVAGGKMKERGTSHWKKPNVSAFIKSGFSALPGGCRNRYGIYANIGTHAFFWSSTGLVGTFAYFWGLNNAMSAIVCDSFKGHYGFSVRCIRD